LPPSLTTVVSSQCFEPDLTLFEVNGLRNELLSALRTATARIRAWFGAKVLSPRSARPLLNPNSLFADARLFIVAALLEPRSSGN